MARTVRLGSRHKEKDSYKTKSSSAKKASREPRQRQLDKERLRHSAATYYLALTKNAYLTAEQMGHAVDVLKQNYNGLARERDAIKYFEILPEE